MNRALKFLMITAISTSTALTAFGKEGGPDSERYPWLSNTQRYAIENALENSLPKDQHLDLGPMSVFIESTKNQTTGGLLNRVDKDRFTSQVIVRLTKRQPKSDLKIAPMLCEVETVIQRDRQDTTIIKGVNARVKSCKSEDPKINVDTTQWYSASPVMVDQMTAHFKESFKSMKNCNEAFSWANRLAFMVRSAKSEAARSALANIVKEVTKEGVCFADIYQSFQLYRSGMIKDDLAKVMEDEWKNSKLDQKFGELTSNSRVGDQVLKMRIQGQQRIGSTPTSAARSASVGVQ